MAFDFAQDIPTEELATVTDDPKRKRIVCKFWLERECSHGDDCKFLHVFDRERMPECRRGNKCTTPGCFYKHTPDEEKEECANYRLGFCPFGSMCRFRHVMRPPAELPPIADIWTPEYIAEARARKKGVEEPHKFRVSMCPVIGKLGFCSFFDMCSYAHVPEQLRQHLQQGGFGGAGGRFGSRRRWIQARARRRLRLRRWTWWCEWWLWRSRPCGWLRQLRPNGTEQQQRQWCCWRCEAAARRRRRC